MAPHTPYQYAHCQWVHDTELVFKAANGTNPAALSKGGSSLLLHVHNASKAGCGFMPSLPWHVCLVVSSGAVVD